MGDHGRLQREEDSGNETYLIQSKAQIFLFIVINNSEPPQFSVFT